MISVTLHGELGKKFGRKHSFDIKTPAEAVRALCANFPDFERHMVESKDRGVAYRVLVKKEAIDLEDIHKPASKSVAIVPVVTGASKGIVKVIVGATLIAASFFVPGGPIVSAILFNVGVSLALSGVVQLLSPVPQSNSPTEDKTEPSYLFDGAVNTTAQGNPVPIGYGRLIVGSAVISAGVDTVDITG